MRNLRNVRFGRWKHQDITSSCWDPETDELLCTIGPTSESSNIDLVRISERDTISHRLLASWDAPSPSPDISVDRVVNLQYLSGTGTACVVFEGGDIVTVQDTSGSGEGSHIEIMGSIDAGIAAARWSPDEELLVIATKADTAIFMGSTFDPVAEATMEAGDLNMSKQVSVGWGKKETQFEGRGAKAMRDPTIPEKVDEGVPSPKDDGATEISWRGDGAFVAINSVEKDSRRVIRVYSREGELDGVSEAVDGLESALSWRPAGNLMASVQRFENRVDVVFFERNGLRHGEFTLRSPESDVVSHEKVHLEWNTDSTVLAVVIKDRVQLWTMGNYHWYLEQEIPTTSTFRCLSWHPEKPLRFTVASHDHITLSEQILQVARGSCRPPHDYGAVAVVDGETVKLTPFRAANVPPPMALFEVTVESSVIDVAFGLRNASFAVLHQKGVDMFDWPEKNGRPAMPKRTLHIPFEALSTLEPSIPLRICCTSDNTFRCIKYEDEKGYVHLEVPSRDSQGTQMNALDGEHQMIVSTATRDDGDQIEGYGQDRSGRLFRISSFGNEALPIQFPAQLPWFEVSKTGDFMTAFGLSRTGHIYANSRLLAKNCTSFTTTPSHLIFTTSNHLVKYVHLGVDIEELEVPADDPEKDERCRSIERGARLVTAIPTNMSIVLQMPRGNVETIFPRAMVVSGIRDLIDEKNYGRAFSYCRTQRVDMNILYDHQPAQFLANVTSFLDQLKDISYIDLFLSSLRGEDVTESMYQDTRPTKGQASEDAGVAPKSGPGKVNTVCDAILKALHSRKATNLQNIITAHVCKSPPALDDGLTLVAELMQEDEKLAEKAVEHICFLVDVNRVYENALGLYNLDLTLLVAQQAQRDPREYLPFIQNLHVLPELRRKFEIDDHLSRRTKALSHLQAMDVFDELCTYTVKHTLYQDALKLYRYDQPRLHKLTDLYANYLESTSAFREAGLAYESLGNYAKATNCYCAAGAFCWQECLVTAQQQEPPLSTDAMTELASTLADALWETKDYEAAATIHAEYLDSIETAIKCLCKGYHFASAMRLIIRRCRQDLMASALDAGLVDALSSTTEFLADCKGQLNAQVPRVAELRQKAIDDPLAFYEGERPGGGDIPDDVSVAASSRVSTSASLFTRYTGKNKGTGSVASTGTLGTGVSRATSKNRRREEKKRARGRKGTVYEEEYLINSIRRLIERVSTAESEVERLVFALVRRGMSERARAVEALMADVTAACEKAVEDVFRLRAAAGEDAEMEQGGWRGTGGEAVLQEFVAERRKLTEPPLIKGMKKLTLLGS